VTTSQRTRSDETFSERYSFGYPEIAPNQLIQGDNVSVLRSLPDACIDLIYADPPFFSGRDHDLASGDSGFADTWNGGLADYLQWLRQRFVEMRRVLHARGVLCVHCDWHAGHHIKVELDSIFGMDAFRNEIVWHYGLGAANATRHVLRKHDTLLIYGAADSTFNRIRGDVTSAMLAKYCHEDDHGRYMMSRGRRYYLKGGKPLDSVWNIPAIAATSRERTGYPTQKPLALLDRVVRVWSNEGDVVADFFGGSGTTGVAAQRRNRRWLLCDDSTTAIDTARSRLIVAGEDLARTGAAVPDFVMSACAEGAQPSSERVGVSAKPS
jgi:DNA modification methylase